ncbi:hypothetical protein JL720_5790 [Aureococcus anophagefferens]|nr:hypothetical protein JL720_5790 [Aureococcus anophagefferens]
MATTAARPRSGSTVVALQARQAVEELRSHAKFAPLAKYALAVVVEAVGPSKSASERAAAAREVVDSGGPAALAACLDAACGAPREACVAAVGACVAAVARAAAFAAVACGAQGLGLACVGALNGGARDSRTRSAPRCSRRRAPRLPGGGAVVAGAVAKYAVTAGRSRPWLVAANAALCPAYLAVGSGARDVSLALLVCEALDVLDDDDVLAGHFRGLVAAIAPRRVWRDAVDRATGDVVALKLVKAAAATPEDDGEEDADDALATPRCATTLVRLLDAPETERGRVALDALSLLLQGHGLRAVAARRASRSGATATARRAGSGASRGRLAARGPVRAVRAPLLRRPRGDAGLIATSASAAEARATTSTASECSRLALDVGARELERVENDAEPPRTLVEALAFFVVATEAVRVVASDHALRAEHRRAYAALHAPRALAALKASARSAAAVLKGEATFLGTWTAPRARRPTTSRSTAPRPRRAAPRAAALYLHEARDFDAAPELRAALKPAVLASRAAHRLSTTRVDESGVPYFEDGRETTWRAPDAWVRAARAREGAAGGDPAVVRRRGDWAERRRRRRVYYANEAADLSQWERPDAFGAPPDDGPDARVADDGPDERPSEDGPDSPPSAAPLLAPAPLRLRRRRLRRPEPPAAAAGDGSGGAARGGHDEPAAPAPAPPAGALPDLPQAAALPLRRGGAAGGGNAGAIRVGDLPPAPPRGRVGAVDPFPSRPRAAAPPPVPPERILGFGGAAAAPGGQGGYDDANDAAAGPSRTNAGDGRVAGSGGGAVAASSPGDAAGGGRGPASPSVRRSRIVGMGGDYEGGVSLGDPRRRRGPRSAGAASSASAATTRTTPRPARRAASASDADGVSRRHRPPPPEHCHACLQRRPCACDAMQRWAPPVPLDRILGVGGGGDDGAQLSRRHQPLPPEHCPECLQRRPCPCDEGARVRNDAASVRGSRIVGFGGGDDANDAAAGPSRTQVRGSRIVGFGGGGERDASPTARRVDGGDPSDAAAGGSAPSVRASRIVGYGGGDEGMGNDDPTRARSGAVQMFDAPGGSTQRGRGPGRGPPPVGGYDDAAGRDMPYGGGTPIDADSVGGAPRTAVRGAASSASAAASTAIPRPAIRWPAIKEGRVYGGGTPIEDPSAAAGYGGGTPMGNSAGAPRTAVRGSRIVGFGGGGEYDDPAAGDPMAGDRGDAGPSMRGSRIVGYGGGGDYDDPAADALGGSRGPGHGPPPVGGYDDAAGQGRVYGGGTPIEDPSAAPGYGGGTPMDNSAGAQRTAVRGSRIVGFGGGGEYDDPAGRRSDGRRSRRRGPIGARSRIVGYGGGGDYDDPAADALGGSRGPGHGPPPVGGYDDAAGQGRVYGGGTPIEDPSAAPGYGGGTPMDDSAGAQRTAVRGSRIVGFGGGGEYDDPAAGDPMAGDRGDAGPSVRGSRIVGYGGGGDYDDPAAGDPGAAGLSDAPGGSAQRGRGPGRGPPPVGGYDDAAGRDMPYGGGTPIDADSVGGAPRTAVRGSRIVGFGGGGEYDDPAAGDPMAGDRGDAGPSRRCGRGPPPVGGYDDAAGRDMPYGGGTPINADSVGAPRTAVRGAASSASAAAASTAIPRPAIRWLAIKEVRARPCEGASSATAAAATTTISPSAIRAPRALRRSRRLGAARRAPRPRASARRGYDDAAGRDMPYGGGTPIDADSVGAPRTAVRGSRIVGFGGGGEYDDPAAGDPMAGDQEVRARP